MRIINNILKIFTVSLFLFSCSGGLEGFKLKRKSTSGDEFLIEKKDPLVLPPDFSKLPNPEEDIQEKESQFEIVFKNDNSENDENENTEKTSTGLEKSILEKIQK